jgi:hypothetical protein
MILAAGEAAGEGGPIRLPGANVQAEVLRLDPMLIEHLRDLSHSGSLEAAGLSSGKEIFERGFRFQAMRGVITWGPANS